MGMSLSSGESSEDVMAGGGVESNRASSRHSFGLRQSASGSDVEDAEKYTILFNWNLGGSDVYVTGDWDGWTQPIPLVKSQKDFISIQNLPPGIYKYKFIVDGKYTVAQDQPTAYDGDENVNVVRIEEPQNGAWMCAPVQEVAQSPGDPQGSPISSYKQEMIDGFVGGEGCGRGGAKAKGPALLPPHLLRALLNTASPSADPSLLPVPHHVMLNHLYVMKNKKEQPQFPLEEEDDENVSILGSTLRYQTKFVTYVYYKPEESDGEEEDEEDEEEDEAEDEEEEDEEEDWAREM